MSSKKLKRVIATISAVAILAATSVAIPIMSVSAGQVLGETSFDYKLLPWRTCESSPARQDFVIEDGALHLKIITAKGADSEKWDLQTRCRNLNFKANHEYTVSFKVKAKRAGMELCSKIANIKGDEEYFVLNENKMQMGPHMGGQWGKAIKLTTEYQEVSGTFIPTKDIEAAEWAFHYAKGTNYEGNAIDGDEIWFDEMSIICETCDDCDSSTDSYGAVNRDYSRYVDIQKYAPNGKLNNYISVNQLGYCAGLSKVAVLGDNKGDILYGASKIDLTEDTYEFNVCNATTGAVVYTGTSGKKFEDEDSGDNVCKLDFSDFRTPGIYFIKVGAWRSFDFKIASNIYSDSNHNMLTNALNYFYQNRSGIDIEEAYITSGEKPKLAHEGGHKTDTALVQKIWKNNYLSSSVSSKIEPSGGWNDSTNFSKNVIDGGISVWTLQNMYERAINKESGKAKFADGSGTVVIPEIGNKIPDILDETAYELDWMSTMVVQPDEPTWGKYAGLVYHQIQDYKWTGIEISNIIYYEDLPRIVKPPTFAATLNYAACAAQAARLWEPYDATKAAKYLDEAKKSYEAYEKYWYEASSDEENNENSLYAPMYQVVGSGFNGDTEVKDDAYWAACEIFVSAKKMGDSSASDYYSKISEYKDAFKITTRITGGENTIGEGSCTTFNCGNTASAGSMTLAINKDLLSSSEARTVENSILAAADSYIATQKRQGYGIPYVYDGPGYTDTNYFSEYFIIDGYERGSNKMVINNAIVMAYAYDQTKDIKYMSGVTTSMDYLLGTNPLSFSYITGYGTYHVENPHHKFWANELDGTLPKAPDGVLTGGPNAGLQDPYVRGLGFNVADKDYPSQRCYVDSVESWSTNEVTIEQNASLAWVASFLQDEAATAGEGGTVDPNPTGIYGDLDGNGKVDNADLVILSRALIHEIELKGIQNTNADVNDDDVVDIADLALMKQKIMGDSR